MEGLFLLPHGFCPNAFETIFMCLKYSKTRMHKYP